MSSGKGNKSGARGSSGSDPAASSSGKRARVEDPAAMFISMGNALGLTKRIVQAIWQPLEPFGVQASSTIAVTRDGLKLAEQKHGEAASDEAVQPMSGAEVDELLNEIKRHLESSGTLALSDTPTTDAAASRSTPAATSTPTTTAAHSRSPKAAATPSPPSTPRRADPGHVDVIKAHEELLTSNRPKSGISRNILLSTDAANAACAIAYTLDYPLSQDPDSKAFKKIEKQVLNGTNVKPQNWRAKPNAGFAALPSRACACPSMTSPCCT